MSPTPTCHLPLRLCVSLLLAAASATPVAAQTTNAASGFLDRWLQDPDHAVTFSGRTPRFRYADALAEAITDRDTDLVAALAPLFAASRDAELKLLALEIAALRRTAAVAEGIATQNDSLVALVRERPAAGPSGQIERETLSGVAVRFHVAAAEAKAQIPAMERRLAALGGNPDDVPPFPEALPTPDPRDADALLSASPLPGVARLLIQRSLSPLSPSPTRTSALDTVFVDESNLPPPFLVRWGGGDPVSSGTRDAMLNDELTVIREAIQRRLDAIKAWTTAAATIPPDRLRAMGEASELAVRQYRQGAIPISLLIESQDAWFEAMQKSQEVHLHFWRETLELATLTEHPAP